MAKVTRDILEAHLNCIFKANLKLAGQHGEISEHEMMLASQREEVRLGALEKILSQDPMGRIERGTELSPATLKWGAAYILDAVLENDSLQLHFDGLKRVDGTSKLGRFHYVPMLFHESRHLRKQHKVLLCLYGIALAGLQGKQPEIGIVWHGRECRASKVHLAVHQASAKRLLESLLEMQSGGPAPPLILNDHCVACGFRQRCHAQAIAEDNLSLLRGVGAKDIKNYARKGIFTVSQLSHTFRPRRRGKRGEPGSHKRHHSLQAMANRDKTIYVLGSPEVPAGPTRVYFDVESDPEEGFVYLIGMILVSNGIEKQFSFWADGKEDEQRIFGQFLDVLSQLDNFVLFSYGSHEAAFLKRMHKNAELKPHVAKVLNALVNVLSVIYAHIYFPTYTNGLKDIGTCLGCTWTEPGASGRQSLVWRAHWDATGSDEWKQKLLQYNLEDCAALKVVTDQIYALAAQADPSTETASAASGSIRIARLHENDQQGRIRKWGTVNFIHPDYTYINGCAYFKYQRLRVYVQTNSTLRRNRPQTEGYRSRRLKVTRRVEVLASECENCHSTDLVTHTGRWTTKACPRGKRAFDLIASRGGVRLSVIEARSKVQECRSCGAVFIPTAYQRLARYFHGVKSWAMYQHVAHALSFGTIKEMIDVFFGLPIQKAELHRFKAEMAWYYEHTCKQLWEKLLTGHLLHVDETQLRLKGGKTSYIWAFTNLEEVGFLFRPNREGEFLRELLKDFRGVLVSDFYAAYDSLGCPQQKCLVHLIRDMNDDLLENPFDGELQAITKPFGELLRPIVTGIGEHGLRKWHLKRFKGHVADFFELIESMSPRSDAAQALRQRLLKYRLKLFTFLDYDDIPWNNNNAENAIKRFAYYRAHASGMMKESGVTQFLALLSVCQTCKYKGINFWRFLSSRKKNFDSFSERKCRSEVSALDLYPDEFIPGWTRFKLAKERSAPKGGQESSRT